MHYTASSCGEGAVMEILKLLLPFFSGGAIGAIFTAWFQRRRDRMQPIPLIERVNRLVSSELKGFVLARLVGDGKDGQSLEVVQNVREYQLTLRNTSHIHLHNAEVQFDFPSKDIEGRAERPLWSKTTPIQVATKISEPWKGAFRYCIPELPPGDSIEFTFRAVDPSSAEYNVALYNGQQVVIKISKGEPEARRSELWAKVAILFATFACILAIPTIVKYLWKSPSAPQTASIVTKTTVVNWAGCYLSVDTTSEEMNSDLPTHEGPWRIDSYIINTGTRRCFLKWEFSQGDSFTIEPGNSVKVMGEYINTKPILTSVELLFGPDGPKNKATVMLYLREELKLEPSTH
jgi:hypothetical protein